ncbi:armadillo-type protein [Thamnocephalis sphaerospora]|uniref:Armadillo-type protein n=1 Tax=Thamnocephalis sphaerospora TaxID=78915 RepID=A0A4P9XPF6_9FUNG|nr:armadillo-type protein [Thamnocephalis sphaerospora]|eukprot:RKP07868.1 armadillo-type protein [Thamnocephalis sphaerospora]
MTSTARDQLLHALREITSQQPERMHPAETSLKDWERDSGFYSTLQDISLDTSLERDVRWQALIQLKNGIDRYWRSTARHGIKPAEKAAIRARLFENIDEDISVLARHHAILVSKIARIDFPNDWHDLLQVLLSMIQSAAAIQDATVAKRVKQRALYILYQVVKALCSKTLASSRKLFQEIAPQLLQQVGMLCTSHMDHWISVLAQHAQHPDIIADMNVSFVAFKCLRHLIVHGFQSFGENEVSASFFLAAFEYLTRFLTTRNTLPPKATSVTLVCLCMKVCGEPPVASTHERCVIQGMSLICGLIKNSNYTPQKGSKMVEETTQARAILDEQLFVAEFASTCIETLVLRYIPLQRADFEAWQDDPETWAAEDEADHWEYQLRKCSEKLFTDMLSQHHQQLGPVVISMLESVSSQQSTANPILRDAVYCAAGLGANDLYEVLDFDSWLSNTLFRELEASSISDAMQRRRIAWLIGNWVSVKVSSESRPAIYNALTTLMRSGEAMIVRLTAVHSLHSYILGHDWGFETEDFLPLLHDTVNLIAQLLGEVEEAERRMRIINCLSSIVERMEQQASWRHSVLMSLKSTSSGLHPLVLPLIQFSVDPTSSSYAYLSEDGLDLWWVTLQNTDRLTSELASIMDAAVKLLDYGSDSFVVTLRILESYIILDPIFSLQNHDQAMMSRFADLLSGIQIRAARGILQLVEMITQAAPIELYGPQMMSSGLMLTMIKTAMETNEQLHVVAFYFSVMARVIMADRVSFLQVLQAAAGHLGVQQDKMLDKLLNTWFDRFDNISHPKYRKLCALALTELLASGGAEMLPWFGHFTLVWTDVLTEIQSADGDEYAAQSTKGRACSLTSPLRLLL